MRLSNQDRRDYVTVGELISTPAIYIRADLLRPRLWRTVRSFDQGHGHRHRGLHVGGLPQRQTPLLMSMVHNITINNPAQRRTSPS